MAMYRIVALCIVSPDSCLCKYFPHDHWLLINLTFSELNTVKHSQGGRDYFHTVTWTNNPVLFMSSVFGMFRNKIKSLQSYNTKKKKKNSTGWRSSDEEICEIYFKVKALPVSKKCPDHHFLVLQTRRSAELVPASDTATSTNPEERRSK